MSDQSSLKAIPEPSAGYGDLKYYFSNLNTMFSIRGTLAMDMMTAMPPGGLPRRLHDIASITKRIYAETTTPTVTNLLDKVEEHSNEHPEKWDSWNLANLRDMRRIHSHLAALPPDLYIACVNAAGEGRKRHAEAMAGQDWSDIKPHISHVVDLYRRAGTAKQKKFNVKSPYKALLMGYASDISVTQMDSLYDSLLEPLAKLRQTALEKQKGLTPPIPLQGEFSRGDQMWLNRTILEIMGFDFSRGSLQITGLSPMAGGHADDTRILVRCRDEKCFLPSMEDTLYQGARALYLQNLPVEWMSQPVGQDLGSLMLNSLSLMYETIIGRTPQFFEFVASRAEGVFREFRNKSFEPENLYRLKKSITTTARRDESDELTKIFHDVMRYRIERDLINGDLSVDDLPERWNEESRKHLGITPTKNSEGAIQNPDWFTGRFGFIPTNTLSHAMAASLHEKIFEETPKLNDMIQFGDLRPVNLWLKKNIHQKGRSVGVLELMQQITGGEVSGAPLIRHLERRYLSDKR